MGLRPARPHFSPPQRARRTVAARPCLEPLLTSYSLPSPWKRERPNVPRPVYRLCDARVSEVIARMSHTDASAPPSLRPLRIMGVPEHFNHPFHRDGVPAAFRAAGVDLTFLVEKAGTGAMVEAVVKGTTDVAVALTEGILAAIVDREKSAVPLRYCGEYIASPLRWMVATGAARDRGSGGTGGGVGGGLSSLADVGRLLEERRGAKVRISVSRLGSGSHLMAYLLAKRHGWPADRIDFVINNNFMAMRRAVGEPLDAPPPGGPQAPEAYLTPSPVAAAAAAPAAALAPSSTDGGGGPSSPSPSYYAADLFMWEWFTTKPFVDSGEVRVLGHLDTPWHCFGFVARKAWLDEPSNRRLFADACAVIFASASDMLRAEDASCEELAAHLGLTLADAHAWMRMVGYAQECVAPVPMLEQVLETLVSVRVLAPGPGAAAGAAADGADGSSSAAAAGAGGIPRSGGYNVASCIVDDRVVRLLNGARGDGDADDGEDGSGGGGGGGWERQVPLITLAKIAAAGGAVGGRRGSGGFATTQQPAAGTDGLAGGAGSRGRTPVRRRAGSGGAGAGAPSSSSSLSGAAAGSTTPAASPKPSYDDAVAAAASGIGLVVGQAGSEEEGGVEEGEEGEGDGGRGAWGPVSPTAARRPGPRDLFTPDPSHMASVVGAAHAFVRSRADSTSSATSAGSASGGGGAGGESPLALGGGGPQWASSASVASSSTSPAPGQAATTGAQAASPAGAAAAGSAAAASAVGLDDDGRLHLRSVDALPDPAAVAEWRDRKARALAAVLGHLGSFGGASLAPRPGGGGVEGGLVVPFAAAVGGGATPAGGGGEGGGGAEASEFPAPPRGYLADIG
jgi:sulfonate transport system substrate-binding protein